MYQTFTFSNRTAFRRLDHKLNQLDERLEHRCYPEGVIFIIDELNSYTPEEREELAYKELIALLEMGRIKRNRLDFSGWGEYRKIRKQVGKKDVFGKLWVKIQ